MKQQVNFENGHQDTLTRYSNYTWGEAESTCSESRQVHPEIEDIKCTKHGADDKYTYKCTDLEDDLCDCKSTAEMMRWSTEVDLCWMSTNMSIEEVLNEM